MTLAADRRDNAVDVARTRAAIRAAYDSLGMLMSVHAAIAKRAAIDDLALRVCHELGVDAR